MKRSAQRKGYDGWLLAASMVLAAAVALIWLYAAGMQTGRRPEPDAIFVRRVQQFVRRG